MPGISKHLVASPEARMWEEEGELELCRRLIEAERSLIASGELKRFPAVLGIKRGSLYGILNGRCSYNLFYRHVGPAAIARTERSRLGRLTQDDQIFSEEEWKALDLIGLVRNYAPTLLREAPAKLPKNEIYPVAHQLVEDVLPTIAAITSAIVLCSSNCEDDSNSNDAIIRRAIKRLKIPAGFATTGTVPEILGYNGELCELLGVGYRSLKGRPLSELFALIIGQVPIHLRAATAEMLERKVGARRVNNQEESPFCIQFYLDNRQTTRRFRGAFLVTTVAFDLRIYKRPGLVFFAYHLKELAEIP
jgi:hypothetical protein